MDGLWNPARVQRDCGDDAELFQRYEHMGDL